MSRPAGRSQLTSPGASNDLGASGYPRPSHNSTETSAYDRVDFPLHDLSVDGSGPNGAAYAVLEDNDDDGEEEGDLGSAALEAEAEARRRRKGKGRMRDMDEEREEAFDSREPQSRVDEEDEERRVAETLAKWSQAEKRKRQAHRKTSTLVLPSPPITSAQLSSLSRRSSALFRNPSRRATASSNINGELSEPPTEGRRAARHKSIRLPELNALHSVESLETVSSTPTHPTRLKDLREEDDEDAGPVIPDAAAPSNPFRTSKDTASAMSRFIEDLPTQSPNSSISIPTLPRSSTYDDVVVSDDRSTPRPTLPTKRGSERSLASIDTTTSLPRRSGSLESASQALVSPTSHGVNTLHEASHRVSKPWRIVDQPAEDADERENQEDDDVGGVGWLDWLLCGCFRAEGDRDGDQAARTNPME